MTSICRYGDANGTNTGKGTAVSSVTQVYLISFNGQRSSMGTDGGSSSEADQILSSENIQIVLPNGNYRVQIFACMCV